MIGEVKGSLVGGVTLRVAEAGTSSSTLAGTSLINNDATRVGARLKVFAPIWQLVIPNPWINSLVREGYRIELVSASSKVCHYQSPFQSATFNPKRGPGSYSVRGGTTGPLEGTRERSLFSSLPSQKAQREVQDHHKPETPEQIYNLQEVQNGNHKFCCKMNSKGCGYGNHRSEGCLLPYPNTSILPKILRFAVPLSSGVLHL